MMMAARLPASFQEQVVIQGGYKDDTKGLWSEIWNTLMGYINADDSPNKLQQKELLVDLMSQFLSRVAHDSKFYLTCTSTVLRASLEQANCRPLTAAQAFEALHEYAIRILAQPWRAEFTKINMYSGYYVHTVQSRLLEAHRLLEEMGFRVDVTSQTATLREPVDVDQVTKAAIDTLMASVECRIIERILESLPAGAYTPLGVLCYRSSYVGGVEAAVHHLNVTLRQRNFQRYFAPPTEVSGGGGGGGGAAPPVYPWHPAPAAAPTALPPVPTARLVDVGEREPRDNQGWIPKTIRHQPAERSEQRSPAPAALLPATLDEHQLASWDLVGDAATTATAGTSPQVRQPPSYDSLDDSWGDSVRAAALAEHDPAPRGSLPSEYGGVEHNPAPRPSLPADYHQVAAQQVSQKTHQTARQTPQQTPHVQASHSLPRDVHPNSRGSPANDNLMPRSSSLVSDHSKTPRPAAGEQGTAPRSAGGGRGNGAGDSGNSRRPSSQRPSPRPEPSPEPAARPRASPSEPRRPELGAWPTRPEPTAAAPADEQWSCHACTYLNPVSVRVCSMCGKTRQTGSRPAPVAPVAAPPVDPPDDLACPKCTLLNSRRARKCGACEAELQPAK
ncbi:Protein tamozhennic [Amphibalanus amphitrite]|uniref:Protein tamozhennic n=1 Tax=Amphibalanus amphitrite TaxID=1232801 RepID=A0A6A4VGB6_AMPAM|nr:Protein tamozhennic [Amphibalanus amphitrite]